MEERVDILNVRGESMGRIARRSEAHRLGLWHRCFHLWIAAPEEPSGGPYLFAQRRAAGKETWPDRLDVTAAGHLEAGELALDGLRELEEELGVKAAAGELTSLGTRRVENEIPAGLDRELQEVFLLVRPLSPEDLKLRQEEVAAVVRLRLDDIEALCGGADVPAEEWPGGESRLARSISVRLGDFVPGEGGYISRVARAVRVSLAGGRPGALF